MPESIHQNIKVKAEGYRQCYRNQKLQQLHDNECSQNVTKQSHTQGQGLDEHLQDIDRCYNRDGFGKALDPSAHTFLRIPAASTRTILIRASAAVTFRSLVGGFIPNNPMILDMPRYNSTLTRYGTYRLPSSPIIPVTMPSSFVTIVSATSCRLLTLCTLRLLVRIIDKIRMTAMTTQVITTDSAMSSCTPPIRGRPAGSLIEKPCHNSVP